MRHENLWLVATMLVLTFSVEVSAQPSVQVDVPVLTLQAAVTLALRQNDRLLTVNENIDRANLSVNLARSAFAPKVVPNILGSFGQTNISNQTYNVDASKRFASGTELRSTIGASTFQNQLGNFTNTDTTFMISQPILRGFGRAVGRRSLDRAEFQAGDAVRQQLLAEQQVAVEVASAYYRVVAQREMVEVAQRALGSSRSLLVASTAKLRAGLVSRLDVLRAQQLVAEAEIQLFDAQAAVEDAMDQLRLLFGRGLEYQFVVTQGIPSDVRPIPPEIAVERARENRIDLRSAEARLDEAERDIRYARNQLLPQLDVNVALTRRETTDSLRTAFGLDEFKFATFFAVSMPLDRTPQTLALHNALIDRDRQTRATEMLTLRIVSEVRRAARQQQRLVRGLEVADTSLEFAEQEVELARLRYQRGLSNNLDVVTAEAGLLNASSRRITLLADLAVSRLTLLAAMGTLDPREDVR